MIKFQKLIYILILVWAVPAYANPLSELEGKSRALILFDKSPSSALLNRQLDLLRQRRPALKERKLLVFINTAKRETQTAIGYINLPRGSNLELRQTFAPALHGMTAILIGLDGKEMSRWNKLVEPDELFRQIDLKPDQN